MSNCEPTGCQTCISRNSDTLKKLGLKLDQWDYVIALAGNPNTGKSTVFNNLTGLRQHTGNWPGKTVTRAEGGFSYQGGRYKIVDLPGTYSLLSATTDEQIARDFILFGQPDVTVVVVDATCLERNLNLVLQILQITEKVVVCLNLVDEAQAHGIEIDVRGLSRDLGVPVVPTIARRNEGMDLLLETIADMSEGKIKSKPRKVSLEVPGINKALDQLKNLVKKVFPAVPHAEWIALRLLSGDSSILDAVRSGELGTLTDPGTGDVSPPKPPGSSNFPTVSAVS